MNIIKNSEEALQGVSHLTLVILSYCYGHGEWIFLILAVP